MEAAKRGFWFKIGLWPACGTALLPILATLFHLWPAVVDAPPDHHRHAHHAEAGAKLASVAIPGVSVADDDCHHADEPCDDPPRNSGEHCPLCLWLQGFHALPAPLAPALRLPTTRFVAASARESLAARSVNRTTSQPRAPPISPAV